MRELSPALLHELEEAAGASLETTDAMRVLAPVSTEHVAVVMKIASREKLVVTPAGAGTKSGWGNDVAADLMLSTRELAGVREHVWQDLTATVGAGTTWAAMQESLAQHGQRVALDAFAAEAATVGGVLATNDSGLLRLRYGSLRDLVLGVTVVLADGTIARSGGKVVKNVAGYDLPKLFLGSFGTLGIVTEMTFRLHPIPAVAKSFTARSTDALELAEFMKRALAASLAIERLQMRNESTAFALDVELASDASVVNEHAIRLEELAGALVLTTADAGVWQVRDEVLKANAEATVLKITALPAKLAPLLAGFAQLSQQPDHHFRAVVDPVGVVTVSCEAPPETVVATVEDLRARLRSSGGNVVVLQRGWLPSLIDAWGIPPQAIDMMRAVKEEFDPAATLNTGKFVGGL
ncbi:MAG: FAD-binding oxidoreductase [Acidobacteriaceae bacterium]|nr:FAD-binding oxidoreductase [Acidobacteriaceae bacterium]